MTKPERSITLEKFVADTGDRDRSEVFAGRVAELDWLRTQVATMHAMWEDFGRAQGSIRTVTGCPGIGKTALLRRFAEECRDDHLIVEPTLDDLLSVGALSERARAQVAPALKHVSAAVLGSFKLDAAGRFLGELAERHGIKRSGVLLLLDEAQQVTEDRHGSVIHFLHTGSQGQPIFPVFFGLDDTHDSLERAGASRVPPENRLRLELMDHADSEAVLRNFERTFGVHTPRALAERLLADSQGFPQHLNSALRSLGEEWLRAGGRGDGLDAAAVSEKARARREAYYEGRLGGSFGRNTRIAAAAADLAGRGDMVQEGLIEMLVSSFVETLGWAPSPATDQAAEDFFRTIVRRGLLAPDANGVYRTPIPSFLSWIRDKYIDGDRTAPTQDGPSR